MDSNKHFVFFNVASAGHVMPTRVLAKHLIDRRFKVTYAILPSVITPETTGPLQKTLEDIGCTFVDIFTLTQFMPTKEEGGPFGTLPGILHMTQDLVNWVQTLSPKPSAIVYDPFASYGYYVAQILSIPAICSISFFCIPRGAFDFLFVKQGHFLPLIKEKHNIDVNPGEVSKCFPYAFKNSLNLLYTVEEILNGELTEEERQYLSFSGAMILERKDSSTLLNSSITASLLEKKNSGKKILFVSLGTVVNNIDIFQDFLAEAYQLIIDVIKQREDVHAVLSLGPNAVKFEKDLPSNVQVFSFLPQLEVLALADVFLTHGGNNSVNEALYYGVPLLVLPFFGDQPTCARVTQEMNLAISFPHDADAKPHPRSPAGFFPPERKSFTSESLNQALRKILDNKVSSEASKRISNSFQEKKMDNVIDGIIRFIEGHRRT